jgi:peptidoglycan/LPS O-acetylase OafA/YrhL
VNRISQWFLRLAVLYLIAGIALGIYMAASHDHSMHPVHAHLNLLGWVTLFLFGLFYRFWPEAANTLLARIHFWLYTMSVTALLVLLFMLFSGFPAVEPILGVAAVLVGVAVLCFAAVVWRHAIPSR